MKTFGNILNLNIAPSIPQGPIRWPLQKQREHRQNTKTCSPVSLFLFMALLYLFDDADCSSAIFAHSCWMQEFSTACGGCCLIPHSQDVPCIFNRTQIWTVGHVQNEAQCCSNIYSFQKKRHCLVFLCVDDAFVSLL